MHPLIRRRVANNPSAFTATGTCTYVIGRGSVAVIDPGPEDAAHIEALLGDLAGETIAAILVTHTHKDHSPGARLLKARTGAPILGCGPHRAARHRLPGELPLLDASADRAHRPDREMSEGDEVSGPGWTLRAVETPGHTMNHLAFSLPEAGTLFSGDHVMAWATSVVAPPDGSMRAYLASLDRLRERDETIYWPGHGGPVRDPGRFVRALAAHRRQRESAIRARLSAGDRDIGTIVASIYQGLDPRLRGAAALSVFAHLEDLVERGLAAAEGPVLIDGRYRPAG
ncbi:Hydroxyacylglutathione hydrolase [Methylobacterium jeotgali]|uniref:Hydroxyacylglutathione hydrolase n=1 Tax=Methylobacterium jeotgali TaxID=381630 RepID=A0ABQ4STA8_9HYPH|nr:Hydroxyacylglutathione hydrolase [Methylobacterium jeotgali]